MADQGEKEKRPKEPRSTVVPANASTGKTASGSGPLQARTTLPGATGPREVTYPRVSGFVVASCEGCPQRVHEGRPDDRRRGGGDMEMPEGTERSLVAPTPVNKGRITRCSRPLQAGPPYDAARDRDTLRTDRIVTTTLRRRESGSVQLQRSGLAVGQDGDAVGIDLERTALIDAPAAVRDVSRHGSPETASTAPPRGGSRRRASR